MKKTSFSVLVLEGVNQSTAASFRVSRWGIDLNYRSPMGYSSWDYKKSDMTEQLNTTTAIVMLSNLPWKQIKMILSFLRLHPSIAFQTLLLAMRATPFLLRDSCPQW